MSAATEHGEGLEIELGRAQAVTGTAVALGLMGAWGAGLVAWMVAPWQGWAWALAPLAVALQTWLYTGLFITAHDAMHRVVCCASEPLNDLIGRTALGLYALFSFDRLIAKHHEHHAHPGTGEDPDFHDGQRRSFWGWYATFLWRYLSVWQILGMAIVFNVLAHVVGVSQPRLVIFWVAPSLLSTLQLFYFGTYRPHRDEPGHAWPDEHHARSAPYPSWLSLLTCFHFGYHLEHHRYPWAPWWMLPRVHRHERERG